MTSSYSSRSHQPIIAMLVAALGVAFADAAAAQTRPSTPTTATSAVGDVGHWTVTPFVGVGFSGDLDSGTGAFGAAGGYMWSPRVSFEADLNVLPSSENNGLVEVGSHSWTLTGNLLYHFAGKSFIPYGAIGIGYGHAGVDVNSNAPALTTLSESSNAFVVDFGGGVERRFADRLAVRGDLRYFFGGDLVPDYWRLSAGVTFDLGTRPGRP